MPQSVICLLLLLRFPLPACLMDAVAWPGQGIVGCFSSPIPANPCDSSASEGWGVLGITVTVWMLLALQDVYWVSSW